MDTWELVSSWNELISLSVGPFPVLNGFHLNCTLLALDTYVVTGENPDTATGNPDLASSGYDAWYSP